MNLVKTITRELALAIMAVDNDSFSEGLGPTCPEYETLIRECEQLTGTQTDHTEWREAAARRKVKAEAQAKIDAQNGIPE